MTANLQLKSFKLEGQLFKYTNVIRGYQFRYFVVNTDLAKLDYFMSEDMKLQRPRGSIDLQSAVIAPSEEDSTTFIIHTPENEIFKLRALDARERQNWVNVLRIVSQNEKPSKTVSVNSKMAEQTNRLTNIELIKEVNNHVKINYQKLESILNNLPKRSSGLSKLDKDILILKATSKSCIDSIFECCNLLISNSKKPTKRPISTQALPVVPSSSQKLTYSPLTLKMAPKDEPIEEITDDEDIGDAFLAADKTKERQEFSEENKNIILHLLPTLKVGCDLSSTNFPGFLLEGKSLLEKFADCLAHADLFVRIAQETSSTAEERMLLVLDWYLTAFHSIVFESNCERVKKPYNPILGEIFNCSWKVNSDLVTYKSEQVSHSPAVSAFFMECQQKKIKLNGAIHTKSKYLGMSISVELVGQLILKLDGFNEEYVITLPNFYTRSIVTNPWVELGDECFIVCLDTGYTTSINFELKPFYGDTSNQVFAEVKNKNDEIICKASGQWNGVIEYEHFSSKKLGLITKSDTKNLKSLAKRVVPVNLQKDNESRRLWHQVTHSLKSLDFHSVAFYKNFIEKQQHLNEKTRREQNLLFTPQFFYKTKFDIEKYSSKISVNNNNNNNTATSNSTNNSGNYCWLHKNFYMN